MAWGRRANAREWPNTLYKRARERHLKKGFEIEDFNLTKEWIEERVLEGECEVTGIPFQLDKPLFPWEKRPFKPSLDRIDEEFGYETENIQVVIHMYNVARNRYSEDDLIQMAEAIVNKRKSAQEENEIQEAA